MPLNGTLNARGLWSHIYLTIFMKQYCSQNAMVQTHSYLLALVMSRINYHPCLFDFTMQLHRKCVITSLLTSIFGPKVDIPLIHLLICSILSIQRLRPRHAHFPLFSYIPTKNHMYSQPIPFYT